jgi:hypothetical protein
MATIALYKITEILAKKQKPFEDAYVIKECLVVAGDSLFNDFKNKTKICNAIKEVQLSRRTVTRRVECMSNDTEQQMRQDLEIYVLFSLQLYESTNVSDVSQLLVFILMVFNDGNIKEELFKTIPLHGETRGEDIFQSFYASLLEMNVPIHKLVSITTDGAPAMTSENVGLVGLCKKDPFPRLFLVTTVSFISKLYVQK